MKIIRRTACLLLSTSLFLSGCANTGSSLFSTQPDSRLTSGEQAKFFSSSGAQGCGLGALSGAGIGALAGALSGDSKSALKGALIGGAAGCATGMAANYYLDSLQKKYKNTADRLQAMNDDITADTTAVEKNTAAMNQVIKDNRATLTRLSIQKDQAGFDKSKASKDLAQIDANIAYMKDKIKVMREKSTSYQTALKDQAATTRSDKTQLVALNKEYNQLNNQITALENEANGLYNQRSALSLG